MDLTFLSVGSLQFPQTLRLKMRGGASCGGSQTCALPPSVLITAQGQGPRILTSELAAMTPLFCAADRTGTFECYRTDVALRLRAARQWPLTGSMSGKGHRQRLLRGPVLSHTTIGAGEFGIPSALP